MRQRLPETRSSTALHREPSDPWTINKCDQPEIPSETRLGNREISNMTAVIKNLTYSTGYRLVKDKMPFRCRVVPFPYHAGCGLRFCSRIITVSECRRTLVDLLSQAFLFALSVAGEWLLGGNDDHTFYPVPSPQHNDAHLPETI